MVPLEIDGPWKAGRGLFFQGRLSHTCLSILNKILNDGLRKDTEDASASIGTLDYLAPPLTVLLYAISCTAADDTVT